MISLRTIDENNFSAIMKMKRPEGESFVASTAYSLAQAWLYRDAGDVFPFAIYHDEEPVGFLMLDEDLEERCLAIWRLLFPPEHQFKGYGSAVIQLVIDDAKASGKYDFLVLSTSPENAIGLHVYQKMGFVPTGEMEHDEMILRRDL